MALTRKFLKALGIEDDKIEQIVEAHAETVDALKDERDSYKAKAEEAAETQKELDTMKAEKQKNDADHKTAKENLKGILEQPKNAKETEIEPSAQLTVYDADISQPSMEDVKRMFGRAVIKDESDKKVAKDMQTWMNIVDRKF